jgi:hypothetical protein
MKSKLNKNTQITGPNTQLLGNTLLRGKTAQDANR